MPEMKCFDMCPEVIAIELPTVGPPQPVVNGGATSVSTMSTADITFSGDGSADNPITASFVPDRQIEFEIAVGKLNGMLDGELISIYTPAHAATIPADQTEFQLYAEDVVGDIILNLSHNGLVVGSVSLIGNAPTLDLDSDIQLAIGDRLEVIAATSSEFSLLSLTIIGLRQLEYAA